MEGLICRAVNARQSFIASVTEQFGFSSADAAKILSVYLEYKIVRIDPVMGQFDLKHGAFWDRVPMENALKEAKQP